MNPSGPETSRNAKRQALSELMDGRGSAATVQQLCQDWRQDPELRQDWLAYHVVGDVLRTPEMAPRGAERDAQFMQGLRAKLAAEPVVMAPQAGVAAARQRSAAATQVQLPAQPSPLLEEPTQRRRGQAWRLPLSVAAGLLVMAGVTMALRDRVDEAPSTLAGPAMVVPAVAPALVVNDQRLMRDPRMDNYLQAHRQFNATAGGLHNVAMWTR